MQLVAQILPWAQVIISILLVGAILLQQGEEGLGAAFGGGSSGADFHTKRGLERKLFIATIVLGILFAIVALAILIF